MSGPTTPGRDELALQYLDQLPWTPYPVQEQALFAWFEAEQGDHVSAVVMDEFHSFADPERGIVWELSLSLLPPRIRLLLLSATVGNALEFVSWLERCHQRKVKLVEGKERKVPLSYHWVPDMLL